MPSSSEAFDGFHLIAFAVTEASASGMPIVPGHRMSAFSRMLQGQPPKTTFHRTREFRILRTRMEKCEAVFRKLVELEGALGLLGSLIQKIQKLLCRHANTVNKILVHYPQTHQLDRGLIGYLF